MKNITTKLITLAIAIGSIGFIAAAPTGAVNVFDQSCGAGSTRKICDASSSSSENIENNNFIRNVINTLLYLLGAVAVIMIIYGGFTYVTANGDANRTKQAKNIILYAVVGLVIAIMAWGIVAFVVGRFN